MNLSSGYCGSSDIVSSVAGVEIIPEGVVLKKFSVVNYSQCHIKVNNSEPIYLASEQGFNCDNFDTPIKSFIIMESGINFNWAGSFRSATIR
ncbi:hypothetical protein D3C75_402900 [compost metagenome]